VCSCCVYFPVCHRFGPRRLNSSMPKQPHLLRSPLVVSTQCCLPNMFDMSVDRPGMICAPCHCFPSPCHSCFSLSTHNFIVFPRSWSSLSPKQCVLCQWSQRPRPPLVVQVLYYTSFTATYPPTQVGPRSRSRITCQFFERLYTRISYFSGLYVFEMTGKRVF
jgi:hypothetical protein